MSRSPYSLNQAMDAFVEALTHYQRATLEMNCALQRLNHHNHAIYASAKGILETTLPAIASRATGR